MNQLDPSTCIALKPILDDGNAAIKERHEWHQWCVEIAGVLNVSCSNFASEVVSEQYAELRARITKTLTNKTTCK